jgi:hypothetical protein
MKYNVKIWFLFNYFILSFHVDSCINKQINIYMCVCVFYIEP